MQSDPENVDARVWSLLSAALELVPEDLASRCPSSLFSIGKDHGLQISHPLDNLPRSLSGPPGDHLPPKDQDTSSQHDCLRIPTLLDPVIDITQGFLHNPGTTMWQQQQTLQPALALPQGDLFQQQQPLDSTQLWMLHAKGLPQQAALNATSAQLLLQGVQQRSILLDPASAQLQIQPLLQGNSSLMGLSGLSVSLLGSSSMPMQQQVINATINGVPVVLQVQDTAPGQGLQQLPALRVLSLQDAAAGQGLQQLPSNIPLQCMEQVYVPPAEQNVYIARAAKQQALLVNTNQVAMQQAPTQASVQPVQQQQLLAGSVLSAGASTDPVLQLQQLQEALQQLSSQSAEIQRVLDTQVSQPQPPQAQTGMLSMEGGLQAATSPPKIQSMISAQTTTGTANSPISSHSGYDSVITSSWHGAEPLSNSNTSSPSFVPMQHQHMSSSLALHGATSHSSSMPCVVSAPEMPQFMVQHEQQQQPGQEAPTFSLGSPGAPVSEGQVLPSTGDPDMKNQNQYAGAGTVSGSTGTLMPQPPARGAMGLQGCRSAYTTVCDQCPGMPSQHQQQPGRLAAAAGSGACMQRPCPGSMPFSCGKGHQQSQGSAGRITPVSSIAPAAATASPAPYVPGPWNEVSLEFGLQQLWSAEELAGSKGGRLYNVQQLAWPPEGDLEFTSQDMYNFPKLKRMVQKLDAVHKSRIKLIKRIHAVAAYGGCDLKGVYREVRSLIGEMLHDSSMKIKSLEQSRVTGVVRLALMLQEALNKGPATAPTTTAAMLSSFPAKRTVQVQSAVSAHAVQVS